MQKTIQLQIEDNKIEIFLTLIDNLKEGIVKNITVLDDYESDKETYSYIKTKQYKEDKKYFQICLKNIEDKKTETLSHKAVWEQIDKHTKAYN